MDNDVCLFLSTVELDPVSAFIRRMSNCAFSHAGFFRIADRMTYSAMSDGKGLAYRPIAPNQKMLYLTAPGVDLAYALAQQWEGSPYDLRDIAGILLGQNWETAGHLICDVTLFKSFRLTGNSLVNPTFIPEEHLTPRDILLSGKITEITL